MRLIIIIGIGGFIGAALRYMLGVFLHSKISSTFPAGTFSVNIIGCFFIGVIYALSEKGNISNDLRLFLATGILGGFTTFSSFSNEAAGMLRDAQYGPAFLYISSSVILGLAATFCGIFLMKAL